MKYSVSVWKGNPCNECHSKEDVKTIDLGNYAIFLCKSCRVKLIKLLKDDENK